MLLIAAVTMTLAACSAAPAERPSVAVPVSSSTVTPDVLAAIRAVLASSIADASASTFPEQPGLRACLIQGGGPYPGIRVPGTCQTSVSKNGSLYLVTLSEYWDASAFYGDGDPSQGPLSHAWQYEVDGAMNVTFIDSWGNFPPQEVS